MNPTHASRLTQLKVGFFALFGLLLLGVASVVVSGRPMWWKACQLVQISVDDATGLKSKAPVRSLGIQIGYLKSVSLSEQKVTLGICITAPVEVLPTTRAYLRGEGFLGDKFVELKPVKYLGAAQSTIHRNDQTHSVPVVPQVIEGKLRQMSWRLIHGFLNGFISSAYAEVSPSKKSPQVIPVGGDAQDMQQVMRKVDEVLNQVSGLADNLKNAIDPDELKKMMKQINQTLQNAAKTLAPEGGLTQTAQRSLGKLEDAIEQLRDMMTRINRGEGSLGKLINDPAYAEEIHLAIKNVNRLLNRVSDVRFHLDIGGVMLSQYKGGRGWFQLGIWPQPDRYYLLGLAVDPRGSITNSTVTTTVGGITQVTQTQVVEPTKLLFTAMLGKVFYHRLDLSLGALYGDGAVSAQLFLGPVGSEDLFSIRTDLYVRNNSGSPIGERLSVQMRPFSSLYLRAGVESFQNYNGPGGTGGLPLFVGGGLSFDDDDIKLLFTLK